MTLTEFLTPVLNNILDMDTEGLHTRAFENILRWELEKETLKPEIGQIEIEQVTLYEVNITGTRNITIKTCVNFIVGTLQRKDNGIWQLITPLQTVNHTWKL